MLVFLDVNGISIDYDARTMEELIIAVATGDMSAAELSDWIKNHSL